MAKNGGEWNFSSLGPRSHTEVEKFDDGTFEGAIVRTIKERAIVGVPVEQVDDPDPDEVEKLISDYVGNGEQQRQSESRRFSSIELEKQVKSERDEAVRDIRDRVSKEVDHFESARQRLHQLLHKPATAKEEAKVEGGESNCSEERDFCERCRDLDLEVLIEENKVLKLKLAECQQDVDKEEFSCKCQMMQKVDFLKREEQTLLETISLKMERIEALQNQDHEAELIVEQTKMKLCARLSERNKIDNLFTAAEEDFAFKCKQIKDFQEESKRLDERTKKLREEAKKTSAKHSEAEKQVKSLHSQLAKLQAECQWKEAAVLKQRDTMVKLDDAAVKLRSEIQNLKEELQMLVESLKFHRREVEERHKQAQALILDEQHAEKQLEAQKSAFVTQKQNVATEMERTKALELIAGNCLQEAEGLSKALQRLRCSKQNVESEVRDLSTQIGCKEAEIEAEVDRLETLKQTLQNLTDERFNVGEMLLRQVRRDRAKIKALLDDIAALGALLCEAIFIRSLIDHDNKALESAMQKSSCSEEQAQEVYDLEQQLDKHKRLIAALGEKSDAFEISHENWSKEGDDEDEERVVRRTTYERVRTASDDPASN